jgi:hypothetical protein
MERVRPIFTPPLAIPISDLFLTKLQLMFASLILQCFHLSSVVMYVTISLEADQVFVLNSFQRLEDLRMALQNKRLISFYVQVQRVV